VRRAPRLHGQEQSGGPDHVPLGEPLGDDKTRGVAGQPESRIAVNGIRRS
jgi:hypothetical protein